MAQVILVVLGALGAVQGQFPPFIFLESDDHGGTNYTGTSSGDFALVGASVAGGFDADGTGAPDLLVGAPGVRDDQPGRAFLILDRAEDSREVKLANGDGVVAIVSGSSTGDRLGTSVAAAGDVDGDGFDDFLIGIPRCAEAPGGGAALIFGRSQFSSKITLSADIPRLGLLFLAPGAGESAGAAVAAVGDVNGDGFPDLAIGAPRASPTGPASQAGRVYLVLGGPGLLALKGQGRGKIDLGLLPPAELLRIDGPAQDGLFGSSVAGAGDLDGDGIADLAAGAPGLAPGGSAFIVFGGRDLVAPDLSAPDGASAVEVRTSQDGAALGSAMAGGIDVTGDQVADLLLGAPGAGQHEGSTPGVAILLSGGAGLRGSPVIDVTSPRPGVRHLLGVGNDQVGASVALVSDFDGDGIDDILVGGPRAKKGRGVAYLANGSASLPSSDFLFDLGVTFTHGQGDSGVGSAVAGLGDRDGDGLGDIAIGASRFEVGDRNDAGAVYEVLSPSGSIPGPAPRGLSCRILPGQHVQLSWNNIGRYSSLSIIRDGVVVATPPSESLFFIDTSPLAGEHSYKVQANKDPRLTSAICRVDLRTLPVNDLSCEQVPGTTRVHLSWRPGDDYHHLAVLLDGLVIQDDLSGDATSFEFDPGPGSFQITVSDLEGGQDSFSATCQIQVIPFGGSQVGGLTCEFGQAGEDRKVSLRWDANPEYQRFRVIRDGLVLATVEGTSYEDDGPHAGLRAYQVVGLAGEIHLSAPATCSVQVPGEGGKAIRGRVAFADSLRTPIRAGRVTVYDDQGIQLGSAQPGDGGEFEISTSGGAPASLLYEATLPRIDAKDPVPSHTVRVEAAAVPDAFVELEVPVPAVAFSGLRQDANRWKNLIQRLEGLRGLDGRLRGVLAFGFEGEGEIARSAREIDASIRKVIGHLGTFLASEPTHVDLIAHGFSGLAARAYLQGLAEDARPARALVLLGTPNLGSNLAGLDAQAAAPDRFSLIGPEGREEDLFTAAGEQTPEYLADFNRRMVGLRGAAVHLVAGLGGNSSLQAVLGCAEHDGRVCRKSALGGIPGAAHTVAEVHEELGRSPASIDLIAGILLAPGGGGTAVGGGAAPGGGQVASSFETGTIYSSILSQSTTELELYSDTSGSVIIILNNESPGVIDFTVRTPDGTGVDPAKAGALLGVSYHTFSDGEGHQIQSYEFDSGQVGNYVAVIENVSPTLRVPYSVQIYLDSKLSLTAGLSPGDLAPGEAARVTAAVALNGAPVLGAAAEARISRPDGGFDVLSLLDDGQGPDLAPADGIYSASYSAPSVAGLYSLTLRATGSTPFPYLRDETTTLLVRSGAASFQPGLSTGSVDRQADGILEGLWVEGSIQAADPGVYMVIGTLSDLAGKPVVSGGTLFGLSAPGPSSFRIFFSGKEIASSGRDGPYRLADLEILDGNRGFLLCERQADAMVTSAYILSQFGAFALPRFVRGDVNVDGIVDLSDGVAILWNLFSGGPALRCPDAADSNADLAVDLSDAISILDILFQGKGPLPPPYPACGSVPALGCPSPGVCP